jgi:pimeloyl-ACP methyl ester carboxylesterase
MLVRADAARDDDVVALQRHVTILWRGQREIDHRYVGLGLSRVYDMLEVDRAVDPRRVIVIGHSRYGKAALWAGARDPRLAMVIADDAGEGGNSLCRRRFGETIRVMNNYWFAPRFKTYAEREGELPVDARELVALIAPRPVYIASAAEDWWSDAKGEFLSVKGADPVYRLFGPGGPEAGRCQPRIARSDRASAVISEPVPMPSWKRTGGISSLLRVAGCVRSGVSTIARQEGDEWPVC